MCLILKLALKSKITQPKENITDASWDLWVEHWAGHAVPLREVWTDGTKGASALGATVPSTPGTYTNLKFA